jgi:hypothetical protein
MPFHEDERLTFVASWLGLPAAQAQLWLHRDPADPALWTCEAVLKTNRAVDVFFKMRDYMREQFRSGSFAPRDMYVRQRENYRHDDFNVWFDRGQQLVTMSKRNSHGVQLKQYRASNPWGMLSGAAMALSQPMAVGEKYTFDVFSATTRYVLSFEVAGRERIDTPLGTIDALRLVPSVLYLSNGKFRADAQSTNIWISADGRKLPLRVESATFIGAIRIDLVKVEQRPQTAAHRAELLR